MVLHGAGPASDACGYCAHTHACVTPSRRRARLGCRLRPHVKKMHTGRRRRHFRPSPLPSESVSTSVRVDFRPCPLPSVSTSVRVHLRPSPLPSESVSTSVRAHFRPCPPPSVSTSVRVHFRPCPLVGSPLPGGAARPALVRPHAGARRPRRQMNRGYLTAVYRSQELTEGRPSHKGAFGRIPEAPRCRRLGHARTATSLLAFLLPSLASVWPEPIRFCAAFSPSLVTHRGRARQEEGIKRSEAGRGEERRRSLTRARTRSAAAVDGITDQRQHIRNGHQLLSYNSVMET
jgi:hypothetical protein